ncbi:MAG: GMP synthase [Gammaproteobacteria bacterium]|nr:GMP synthase [Gammaproteobacteria bacterium]MBI5616254.1 GMP synthase [Gammaproteobacteria bacterium]
MVRIGILACDAVREPLLGRHGDYPDMFERLLAPQLPAAHFVTYRVHEDEYPGAVTACDAYIISGSRSSVYESEPWIVKLAAYVGELYAAGCPIVGVCFGHQMLAHALGGRTERAQQGWGVGRYHNAILDAPDWMQPAPATFTLYFSHQDQVTALPPEGRLIARNGHCSHAMIEVGGRALGIQGHPEFTADFARELLLAKVVQLPAAVLEAALPGYEQTVDADVVAQWIAAYLCADSR